MRIWPPANEECVYKGAERTDGVDTGGTRFSRKIYLDGADLSEIHRQVEVMECTTNSGAKMPIEFRERNGCDMNGTDLRKINVAGAIYPDIGLKT